MTRAPLRFLPAVMLLWAGVRAAILRPGPAGDGAPVPAAPARSLPATDPSFASGPSPMALIETRVPVPAAGGAQTRPEIRRRLAEAALLPATTARLAEFA